MFVRCVFCAAAILAAALRPGEASAAESVSYPQRPVRIIVPVTAGGGVDATARIVAEHLSQTLGQRFVVDNRSGAGGSIGVELVVGAARDGHTLLVSSSSLVTNAVMQSQRYDPVRDLQAVTKLTSNPYILAVTAALPVHSVAELVSLARAKPGVITYASSGTGGVLHLGGELLCSLAGVKMTHVPYKGVADAYPAVVSGDVSWILGAPLSALPLIRAKRLKALAVTSPQRSQMLPELPTIAEAGVRGYDVTAWFGLFAPAGVSPAIIERLHREASAAIRAPEVARRMSAEGTDVVGNTPAEFGNEVKAEHEKWRALAGKVKIAP
jgi:tripartite-type tricarboxylate transporter receptor subunit TctC